MSKNLSEEAERRLTDNASGWNDMMRDRIPTHISEPRAALHVEVAAFKKERLALLEEFKKIIEMPISMRRIAVQRMIDEASK